MLQNNEDDAATTTNSPLPPPFDSSQLGTLPETMIPTDPPSTCLPLSSPYNTTSSSTTGKQPKTIDALGEGISFFIKEYKGLEAEYNTLKQAFEAQKRELHRSRQEYLRKVEEWRAFKASLERKNYPGGSKDKAVMTNDHVDFECNHSHTQETMVYYSEEDLFTTHRRKAPRPSPVKQQPDNQFVVSDTPPGYWEVNFTPAAVAQNFSPLSPGQ